METKDIQTNVFGESGKLRVIEFSKSDALQWKDVFDLWRELKMSLRAYEAREPNFPEGLSEVAFCIWSGSVRLVSAYGISNTSFDTFNPTTKRAEQIKACSVKKDLTSFGPTSKWDDLYFLDFYSNGNVDGRFDVYLIPNNLIYENQVNKLQTLQDQQGEKRRPRFSIKTAIIQKHDIKPLERNIQIW